MLRFTWHTVLFLVVQSAIATQTTLSLTSVSGNGQIETCLLPEMRDAAIQSVKTSVKTFMQNLAVANCGPGAGQWYRVAHLNVSNSSQRCPSAWREINTSGIRACRRPETSNGSCPATFYATGRQYSRVCGRAIGYQIGGTDAFSRNAFGQTIESYYVYGVSITHGTPRNHIWTLAAGFSERSPPFTCPCSIPGHPDNVLPPSFVGNNYYCESGNILHYSRDQYLYSTDPLWDGQQCEGQCCGSGISPPWFSVELQNSTTDDIEVRICIPQPSEHDIAIQLLELYVQ